MSSLPKPLKPVIAVVDDDASIRLATDRFLRSRGFTVETFSSAAEFLRSDRQRETSCVITDVRMPNMGGIELQATMRSQGSNLPFIFITAFPEPAVRMQALHDGATCFLSKPFDAPTLIKCLEMALSANQDPPEPE